MSAEKPPCGEIACGVMLRSGGNLGWGPHTCEKRHGHKKRHRCACGEKWRSA